MDIKNEKKIERDLLKKWMKFNERQDKANEKYKIKNDMLKTASMLSEHDSEGETDCE